MRFVIMILVFFGLSLFGKSSVEPVQNERYRSECGSCHFAYQPRFLGQASWEKMFSSLQDHFGTDASLDKKTTDSLRDYVLQNSGRDTGEIQRITDLRWFGHEHGEIPQRFIAQPNVKSLSNCQACHRNAANGDYSERSIVVPGYGNWDD